MTATPPAYTPAPLDTSGVALPASLLELTEKLARNIHEEWAAQRIRDGWRWGPRRNDYRREHPSLIPYEQLSEQEKEYDRITALQTLKAIVHLGWKIS
jgi:hypothetical protein